MWRHQTHLLAVKLGLYFIHTCQIVMWLRLLLRRTLGGALIRSALIVGLCVVQSSGLGELALLGYTLRVLRMLLL